MDPIKYEEIYNKRPRKGYKLWELWFIAAWLIILPSFVALSDSGPAAFYQLLTTGAFATAGGLVALLIPDFRSKMGIAKGVAIGAGIAFLLRIGACLM